MINDIGPLLRRDTPRLRSGRPRLDRWNNFLKVGLKKSSRTYKKEKKNILNKLIFLDKKAEGTYLSDEEIDLKQFLQNKLAQLLREEEIKWY